MVPHCRKSPPSGREACKNLRFRDLPDPGGSFYAHLRVPELVAPLIVDEKQKEFAERYLTKVSKEMEGRGLKLKTVVKTGQQVAVEIIDFAKESGIELIIMCTRGRSGISRWVLGSTAHKVLTRAETPILLLR